MAMGIIEVLRAVGLICADVGVRRHSNKAMLTPCTAQAVTQKVGWSFRNEIERYQMKCTALLNKSSEICVELLRGGHAQTLAGR
jgi:hypothetical protein